MARVKRPRVIFFGVRLFVDRNVIFRQLTSEVSVIRRPLARQVREVFGVLKALAAHDNGVPFYIALPSPTIDFTIEDGSQIPIEQRSADEVATMTGRTAEGRIETVRIVPDGSPVANYAFDVTPARLVSGLITERGLLKADREALAQAFPERDKKAG